MLTCESGTPLDRDVKTGRIRLAAEGMVLDLFNTAIHFLTARSYLHYEVSNFARMAGPNHETENIKAQPEILVVRTLHRFGTVGPLVH